MNFPRKRRNFTYDKNPQVDRRQTGIWDARSKLSRRPQGRYVDAREKLQQIALQKHMSQGYRRHEYRPWMNRCLGNKERFVRNVRGDVRVMIPNSRQRHCIPDNFPPPVILDQSIWPSLMEDSSPFDPAVPRAPIYSPYVVDQFKGNLQYQDNIAVLGSAQNCINNRGFMYPRCDGSYLNCVPPWQQHPAMPFLINSSSCGYQTNNNYVEQLFINDYLRRSLQEVSDEDSEEEAVHNTAFTTSLHPTVSNGKLQGKIFRTVSNTQQSTNLRNLHELEESRRIVMNHLKPTSSGINSQEAETHRILVTNLKPTVSADDVMLLFSEITNFLSVQLICQGVAEVTFGSLESALEALAVYNNRVLDGQPMQCYLVNNKSSEVEKSFIHPNPDIIRNVLFK